MIRNRRGFTLIELVTVIAIVAIALLVTIPAYSSWIPDVNLRSAIRNIKSDMELGRLTAVRENSRYALIFDTVNNSYTLFQDNNGDLVLDAGETTLKSVPMPDNVTIRAAQTNFEGEKKVGFNNRGIPYAYDSGLLLPVDLTSTGFATLRNTKSNKRRVSVTIVGNVRVERWTGSSWVKD